MAPIRSHIPVSRKESARGRCHSIVKGARRPGKPVYGTRRAASQARRMRCTMLVMHRHRRASRAFPDELGKPSYGYHMLDSIHLRIVVWTGATLSCAIDPAQSAVGRQAMPTRVEPHSGAALGPHWGRIGAAKGKDLGRVLPDVGDSRPNPAFFCRLTPRCDERPAPRCINMGITVAPYPREHVGRPRGFDHFAPSL